LKTRKRVDKQTQAAAIMRLVRAGWSEEQILASLPISRATYFRRLNLVRHLESPYATR
jgi:hypothetical protein